MAERKFKSGGLCGSDYAPCFSSPFPIPSHRRHLGFPIEPRLCECKMFSFFVLNEGYRRCWTKNGFRGLSSALLLDQLYTRRSNVRMCATDCLLSTASQGKSKLGLGIPAASSLFISDNRCRASHSDSRRRLRCQTSCDIQGLERRKLPHKFIDRWASLLRIHWTDCTFRAHGRAIPSRCRRDDALYISFSTRLAESSQPLRHMWPRLLLMLGNQPARRMTEMTIRAEARSTEAAWCRTR